MVTALILGLIGTLFASVLGAGIAGTNAAENRKAQEKANQENIKMQRETNAVNVQQAMAANSANSIQSQARQLRASGASAQGALQQLSGGGYTAATTTAPTVQPETSDLSGVTDSIGQFGSSSMGFANSAQSAMYQQKQLEEQKRVNDSVIRMNNANALGKEYENNDISQAHVALTAIRQAVADGILDPTDLKSVSAIQEKANLPELRDLSSGANGALTELLRSEYDGYNADVNLDEIKSRTELNKVSKKLAEVNVSIRKLDKQKIEEELKDFPTLQKIALRMAKNDLHIKENESSLSDVQTRLGISGEENDRLIKECQAYKELESSQQARLKNGARNGNFVQRSIMGLVDALTTVSELTPIKFGG